MFGKVSEDKINIHKSIVFLYMATNTQIPQLKMQHICNGFKKINDETINQTKHVLHRYAARYTTLIKKKSKKI